MESDNKFYNEKFYQRNLGPSYHSAKIVVPLIVDSINPKSVVDIGCGIGTWIKAFKEEGVEDVLGVDFNPTKAIIPDEEILRQDLRKSLNIKKTFDLAISLEVAEHIETKYSDTFVNNLAKLSDRILFSAAIPRQEGENHINEQWNNFWVDKFEKRGYVAVDFIRPKIIFNPQIGYDYRQNMLFFIKKNLIKKEAQKLINYYDKDTQIMQRKSYAKQLSKVHRFFYRVNKQLFFGLFNGFVDKFLLRRFFGDMTFVNSNELKNFKR